MKVISYIIKRDFLSPLKLHLQMWISNILGRPLKIWQISSRIYISVRLKNFDKKQVKMVGFGANWIWWDNITIFHKSSFRCFPYILLWEKETLFIFLVCLKKDGWSIYFHSILIVNTQSALQEQLLSIWELPKQEIC